MEDALQLYKKSRDENIIVDFNTQSLLLFLRLFEELQLDFHPLKEPIRRCLHSRVIEFDYFAQTRLHLVLLMLVLNKFEFDKI